MVLPLDGDFWGPSDSIFCVLVFVFDRKIKKESCLPGDRIGARDLAGSFAVSSFLFCKKNKPRKILSICKFRRLNYVCIWFFSVVGSDSRDNRVDN